MLSSPVTLANAAAACAASSSSGLMIVVGSGAGETGGEGIFVPSEVDSVGTGVGVPVHPVRIRVVRLNPIKVSVRCFMLTIIGKHETPHTVNSLWKSRKCPALLQFAECHPLVSAQLHRKYHEHVEGSCLLRHSRHHEGC